MDDFVFYRELIKGMINSSVKGLYHETALEPISQDCFGNWIDDEVNTVVDEVKKIKDDIWSFTFKDASNVSNTLIHMHYQNMAACDFKRIEDDKKTWCLDNAEMCVGLSGMLGNLYDNAPALFSKATDLYDLISTDDICYSDSELISEVERATEDITSMISTAWGFDLKWDKSRQVKHIKRRDFNKEIKAKGIDFGEYI